MPAGASAKREQEFKKLQHQFKADHRYPGREEEVAARIVNKQRAQYGETKAEKNKDKEGKSPDKNLPIKDYQSLTIAAIAKQLASLSKAELKKIRAYEVKHKNRKGALEKIDRQLQS